MGARLVFKRRGLEVSTAVGAARRLEVGAGVHGGASEIHPVWEGEKQQNQEKLTAVAAEPDSAAGRQGGREVGSKSQSKLMVTRRSEVPKSTQ